MAKDITLKTRNGETRYPKSVTALIYENGTGKTLQTIIDEMRQVDTQTNTRTQHFKADVNNLDTLKNKTDIGLYNYVGTGWRGSVSVCYDSADNVSQVALSSSTPSYNGNTLTWLSAQPCAMARTYTNGAWSHWEKVGAPVVNDLTTGGTDKALSAEMGKTLKEGLDALGPKIGEPQAIPVIDTNKYIKLDIGVGNVVSLTPSASGNGFCYRLLDVSEGDILVVNGVGGAGPRLWGFIDGDNKLLAVANSAATATNLKVVAPANSAKAIINDNSGSMSYYIDSSAKTVVSVDDVVNDLNSGGNKKVLSAEMGKVLGSESIYDVSARNNGTSYAGLAAAISAIPSSDRKVGMSIRFIDSTASSYVSYRFTQSTLSGFATIANWQGVDDVPTCGSANLVLSGGVASFSPSIRYFNRPLQNGKLPEFIEEIYLIADDYDEHDYLVRIASSGAVQVFKDSVSTENTVAAVTINNGDGIYALSNAKGYVLIKNFPYFPSASTGVETLSSDAFNLANSRILSRFLQEQVEYQYGGLVTPSSNPTILQFDGNLFFIAHQAGTYTNFGSIVIEHESLNIIRRNNGSFTLETLVDHYNALATLNADMGYLFGALASNITALTPTDAGYYGVSGVIRGTTSTTWKYANIDVTAGQFYLVKCCLNSNTRIVDIDGNDVSKVNEFVPTEAYIDSQNGCEWVVVKPKYNKIGVTSYNGEQILYATINSGNIGIYNLLTQIYRRISEDKKQKEIVISKNGGGDFTSLLKGILAAEDIGNCTVRVRAGEYDLFAEFKEHYGDTFFDTYTQTIYNTIPGIVLKNNIHVIFDTKALVKFNYSGSNDAVKTWFAPFNTVVAGSGNFILENCHLECSNCRYCVHDEGYSLTNPYRNKYINCHFKIDNSNNTAWASGQCIGGGFGVDTDIEVRGCYFESVGGATLVSWHNRVGEGVKSRIIVADSYFAGNGTFRLTWHGTSTEITEAFVSNNSFGSSPIHRAEVSSDTVENTALYAWNNTIRT